jgi:hypothetical protein
MVRLNRRQRDVLIDKVPDVAHLGFGSLVFGQVLSSEAFSVAWAMFGVALWLALFGWVILLASGESR